MKRRRVDMVTMWLAIGGLLLGLSLVMAYRANERQELRDRNALIQARALERCTKLGGELVRFYQDRRFKCMRRDLFLGE